MSARLRSRYTTWEWIQAAGALALRMNPLRQRGAEAGEHTHSDPRGLRERGRAGAKLELFLSQLIYERIVEDFFSLPVMV